MDFDFKKRRKELAPFAKISIVRNVISNKISFKDLVLLSVRISRWAGGLFQWICRTGSRKTNKKIREKGNGSVVKEWKIREGGLFHLKRRNG